MVSITQGKVKLGIRRYRQLLRTAKVMRAASDLVTAKGQVYAGMLLLEESEALVDQADALMDRREKQRSAGEM